jgi:hypothetical protein
MSNPECVRSTRPCMFDDCHRSADYFMYAYLGAYHWSTHTISACHEHVEQLAVRHCITASDIHPYDDSVPF